MTTGRWSEVRRSICRVVAVLATLQVCYCAHSAAQQSFKMEPAGPPRHEISRELQNRLEQAGIRLLSTINGVDVPLAELWWVKDLTVRPIGKHAAGASYTQLKHGTLLAVLYLPAEIDDVSLRKTPSGIYTLRYSELAPRADEGEEDDEKSTLKHVYHDFSFLTSIDSECTCNRTSSGNRDAASAPRETTDARAASLESGLSNFSLCGIGRSRPLRRPVRHLSAAGVGTQGFNAYLGPFDKSS